MLKAFLPPSNIMSGNTSLPPIGCLYKTILHVYPSPFTHESRILREARALVEERVSMSVVFHGIHSPGLPESERPFESFTVKRHKLLASNLPRSMPTKILRFIEWYFRILPACLKKDVSAVHCHGLSTLPIGVFMKIVRPSIFFVYDAHECETETITATPARKYFGRLVERIAFRYVDTFFVVSQSILDWYKRNFGVVNISLLRNIPETPPATVQKLDRGFLRRKLGLNDEDRIFLYQGILTRGRGVELLLEAFSKAPRNCCLVMLGNGPLEAKVKELSVKHPNILHLSAVPPDELPKYTVGADIGLCLIEKVSLSYYYCLPNKLFEYLQCGVPVLGSDFPEISRVLSDTNSGWAISTQIGVLAQFLLGLTAGEITEKKYAAAAAGAMYSWGNERKVLLAEYRKFASHSQ